MRKRMQRTKKENADELDRKVEAEMKKMTRERKNYGLADAAQAGNQARRGAVARIGSEARAGNGMAAAEVRAGNLQVSRVQNSVRANTVKRSGKKSGARANDGVAALLRKRRQLKSRWLPALRTFQVLTTA